MHATLSEVKNGKGQFKADVRTLPGRSRELKHQYRGPTKIGPRISEIQRGNAQDIEPSRRARRAWPVRQQK